jgi:hypothetical protein
MLLWLVVEYVAPIISHHHHEVRRCCYANNKASYATDHTRDPTHGHSSLQLPTLPFWCYFILSYLVCCYHSFFFFFFFFSSHLLEFKYRISRGGVFKYSIWKVYILVNYAIFQNKIKLTYVIWKGCIF